MQVHKAAEGRVHPDRGVGLRFPRFLRIRWGLPGWLCGVLVPETRATQSMQFNRAAACAAMLAICSPARPSPLLEVHLDGGS